MQGAVWTVVIPVKPLSVAKSRLRGALADDRHPGLVLALAGDTVSAVLACPAAADVIVVSDDPAVGRAVADPRVRVVPDRPGAGLNAAIRYGAAAAPPERWLAALAADLPALRPAELAAALAAAAAGTGRRFVADVAGTGTVLLTAPPGRPLEPRFGPGSAAAHTASGAAPLPGDWPGLRRDVDTAEDLRAAAGLGLGPRTAAVLAPHPC